MKKNILKALVVSALLFTFVSSIRADLKSSLNNRIYSIIIMEESSFIRLSQAWFNINENKLVFKNETSLKKEFREMLSALRIAGLEKKALIKLLTWSKNYKKTSYWN